MLMIDRAEVRSRLLPLFAELVPDWEFDGWSERIDDDTRLIADLDLTSVEFIDIFVGIEQAFGRTIGFHDLIMVEGRYVSDLSFGDLIDFVHARLLNARVEPVRPPPPTVAHETATPRLDESQIARFRAIIPQPKPWPPTLRKNARAIFVLTAPRSGSTLFQTILAGHQALFAPPELHLLAYADLAERRRSFQTEANRHLTSGAVRAIMELEGLTVEAAQALLERYEQERMPVDGFYGLLQDRLGSRLLVDKTPSYTYSRQVLERAERMFDEPIYLHLVRHPGGMVRSFSDARLERVAPFMQRHASEFDSEQFGELVWLTCNRNIVDFLEQIPANRQYRLHYEDLVGTPEDTLRRLCGFLGLDFKADMLDPYQDKHQRMADGLNRVGELSGDLKFHLHERIEPEAAQRWRRFSSEDALSAPTWRLAETLGYRRGIPE